MLAGRVIAGHPVLVVAPESPDLSGVSCLGVVQRVRGADPGPNTMARSEAPSTTGIDHPAVRDGVEWAEDGPVPAQTLDAGMGHADAERALDLGPSLICRPSACRWARCDAQARWSSSCDDSI